MIRHVQNHMIQSNLPKRYAEVSRSKTTQDSFKFAFCSIVFLCISSDKLLSVYSSVVARERSLT